MRSNLVAEIIMSNLSCHTKYALQPLRGADGQGPQSAQAEAASQDTTGSPAESELFKGRQGKTFLHSAVSHCTMCHFVRGYEPNVSTKIRSFPVTIVGDEMRKIISTASTACLV